MSYSNVILQDAACHNHSFIGRCAAGVCCMHADRYELGAPLGGSISSLVCHRITTST